MYLRYKMYIMCRLLIPLLGAFASFFFVSFSFFHGLGLLLSTRLDTIHLLAEPARPTHSPMAWRSQSNARAKQLYLTWLPPGTPKSPNDPFFGPVLRCASNKHWTLWKRGEGEEGWE
ncbi:hypothetical protein ACQKWADRAFT_292548 [Trichoderma austrokoningii]